MKVLVMTFWVLFFVFLTVRYGVYSLTAAQHLKEGRSSILIFTHWWFLRESDFDEEGKEICKKTQKLVFEAGALLIVLLGVSYALKYFQII
jgi:hypothetical protein